MSWKVITTIIPIGIFRSQTKEVTDWRMMTHLLAVDLCTIRVLSLQGLADNRVKRFKEHGDVVKSWECVGDDVFEPLDRVTLFASFSHVVGIHAATHCWVLECCTWDHGFDGEGNSGEIEVTTDDLFANYFDHFFSNWSNFVDLHLICTNLATFVMSIFVTMFLIIGKKSS